MRNKIFPFLVCCMLFFWGCGTSSKIKTGDLLFVGIPADYSADNKEGMADAKTYLGQPYDLYFLPENNMLYCSELVYLSYVRNGKPLFCAAPMNLKNAQGEYPKYWQDLFARLGQPVPQGELGTNPQDMSRSRRLRPCR